SEHTSDDPAPNGPELDGDVIKGRSSVSLLPRRHLCLGQDVGPQGSLAGKALGDLREGVELLLVLGGRLSDHQLVVVDRWLMKCLGHRLPRRKPEGRTALEVAQR